MEFIFLFFQLTNFVYVLQYFDFINIIMLKTTRQFKIIAFIMALVLLVSLGTGQNNQKIRFPEFSEYIIRYGKTYSTEEYNEREKIYNQMVEELKSSNNPAVGANKFADWTEEQKRKFFNNNLNIKPIQIPIQNTVEQFFDIQSNNIIQNSGQKNRRLQSNPSSLDWRQIIAMPPVKDQSQCGSCGYFASLGYFQHDSIINNNLTLSNINLSEQFLIKCDKYDFGCDGSFSENLFSYITERGSIPFEKNYPYNYNKVESDEICRETNQLKLEKKFLKSHFYKLSNSVIQTLLQKGPVMAAIYASDNAFMYYYPLSSSSSKVVRCAPQAYWYTTNHLLLIVGYTSTQWIIKNQWGTNWGINGYAYLSKTTTQNCNVNKQIYSTGVATQSCSINNCQLCVDGNKCSKCEQGRFVVTYTNQFQQCALCSSYSSNCLICFNNYGSCRRCKKGYTSVEQQGYNCYTPTISKCRQSSQGKCRECQSGYVLSSDKLSCIQSTPYVPINFCFDDYEYNCHKCKSGYQVDFYKSPAVCVKSVCQLKYTNCKLCNLAGICIKCPTYYQLNSDKTCSRTCQLQNCLNCVSNPLVCSQCIQGYSLNSVTNKCQKFQLINCLKFTGTTCSQCIQGFSYNTDSSKCKQSCDVQKCVKCDREDRKQCQACQLGYYLQNDKNGWPQCLKCLTISNNINDANGKCFGDFCTSFDESQNCLSCIGGYQSINGKCKAKNCQQFDPQGSCTLCQTNYLLQRGLCWFSNLPNCLKSSQTNPSQCSQCQTGYILQSGKCKVEFCKTTNDNGDCSSCLDYFKLQNLVCKAKNCQVYSTLSKGKCLHCKDNFELISDVCIPKNCTVYNLDGICLECSMKYKLIDNVCYPQVTGCAQYNQSGFCTACRTGYDLDVMICFPLLSNCKNYDSFTLACIVCDLGYKQNSSKPGTCISVCSSTTDYKQVLRNGVINYQCVLKTISSFANCQVFQPLGTSLQCKTCSSNFNLITQIVISTKVTSKKCIATTSINIVQNCNSYSLVSSKYVCYNCVTGFSLKTVFQNGLNVLYCIPDSILQTVPNCNIYLPPSQNFDCLTCVSLSIKKTVLRNGVTKQQCVLNTVITSYSSRCLVFKPLVNSHSCNQCQKSPTSYSLIKIFKSLSGTTILTTQNCVLTSLISSIPKCQIYGYSTSYYCYKCLSPYTLKSIVRNGVTVKQCA